MNSRGLEQVHDGIVVSLTIYLVTIQVIITVLGVMVTD
jgi:hypothetical protein